MNLEGVFPPIPTPFADDSIDHNSLTANISLWMRTRLAGLVVLGSNGEAPLLDDAESDAVIETARAHVPGDRTLIAGVGRESTAATIAAAKRAASMGADVILVRTPSFYKNVMTTDARGMWPPHRPAAARTEKADNPPGLDPSLHGGLGRASPGWPSGIGSRHGWSPGRS